MRQRQIRYRQTVAGTAVQGSRWSFSVIRYPKNLFSQICQFFDPFALIHVENVRAVANRRKEGSVHKRISGWDQVAALTGISLVAAGALAQAPHAPIPLRKGLTIVTAINWPDAGDYESIKKLVAADQDVVTVTNSADVPESGDSPGAGLFGGNKTRAESGPVTRHIRARRSVRREDLQHGHEYRQTFAEDGPEIIPGATALGVSAEVLRELKTKRATELTVFDRTAASGGLSGGLGAAFGGLLGRQSGPGAVDKTKARGTLRISEDGPSTITVLVNGVPTPLPVVHARGRLGDLDCDFYLLDDLANPLNIRSTIGENRLQVVRIEFPADPGEPAGKGPKTIEQQLTSTGKAEIYGIYFDFASDRIKEESEPVLAEIAKVMAQNPSWTLSVEGHTDNIGGDAFNVNLSQRRSAAVRQALLTRYQVAGSRLTTNGFGASRPKDTNETLAGRARNRRVELARK